MIWTLSNLFTLILLFYCKSHCVTIGCNHNTHNNKYKISTNRSTHAWPSSRNCTVLMKAPRACVLWLLTCTGIKTIKKTPRGIWGSENLVHHKSYLFCDLKFCAKCHNPRTTPSGRKVCGAKERKTKNNSKNSVHFVLPKGSARTPLGPKIK